MLIGITGCKGHGKDTVAKMLVARGFTLLRFADPLKNMLRTFYRDLGVPALEIEARIEGVLKQTPDLLLNWRTPRHAMQTLGTEWGRNCIGRDLWVDTLLRRAKRANPAVVPDVRYENECHAIREAGGVVWRVDAGARVAADEFSTHSSELEIQHLPVDVEIDNSGSAEQLERAVNGVLRAKLDQGRAKGDIKIPLTRNLDGADFVGCAESGSTAPA